VHGDVYENELPRLSEISVSQGSTGYFLSLPFPTVSISGDTVGPALEVHTNYRILLTIEDIDSPPGCPIIWSQADGDFTTGDR